MACGPKGNTAGRAGSSRTLSLSPARSGEGDAPDRRGPPGGETGREGMALGWIGPGAGSGPAGKKLLGCGVKKKRQRWAGLKEWEKEKRFSIFQKDSNTFKLNSNSKI